MLYATSAVHDGAHAVGDAEPAEGGLGGHGVRGRDDGPEHERGGPRKPDHEVRDRRDGARGQEHEADGEQPDGAGMRPQVARRGREGSREQQRRDEDDEDDLRRQLHVGECRYQAHAHAAQDQEDRVGDAYRAGQLREQGDDAQEPDQELEPEL
jgi:hypothetical protein